MGDLIDLAQDNSARWPVPQQLPLARSESALLARRHYLRVTGEPHPGLERRIESLVRRAGLSVQNHATRAEDTRHHLAFMISASTDTSIEQVREAVARLARVHECLHLGVFE
jgi:acetolactate synthase small subunit